MLINSVSQSTLTTAMRMRTLEVNASIQEHPFPLEILIRLFRTLNQERVRYCHWKGNVRLDHALSGRADLDLLVDRKDSQLFRHILNEHQVKPVLAAPDKHYAGVENYLGFDPTSGKLFHLHVYYQLVFGRRFTENYRLPLTAHFLDSVQLRSGVPIPTPELELIVLSLRVLLKYRNRDVLKDVLLVRSPGVPVNVRREIKWLLKQTSIECVQQTLQTISNIVPTDIVLEFLQIVAQSSRSGLQFFHLRGRLRHALHPYQRYGHFHSFLQYYRALWHQSKLFSLFSPQRKMTLFNGGNTIAIIGSDGAGKSTIIQHVMAWLSWRLTTRTYYMGSSQPSFTTDLLKRIAKTAQLGRNGCRRFLGEKNIATRTMQKISRPLTSLLFLAEAKDRYNRYLAGQREAAAGSIVFYDRFPLSAVHINGRIVDGPRIAPLNKEDMSPLVMKLAQAEEKIYQNILPAESVFVLQVSLETALTRKPDHKPEMLAAKNQAIRQMTRDNIELIDIEVEKPLDQVLLEVKSILWDLL